MDEKIGLTAAALVGVLLLGAGLGFLGGMVAKETPSETADSAPQEEVPATDDAPLLSVQNAVHPYGVTAFTLHGLVADEFPSTVEITVELVNPLDETETLGPFSTSANRAGEWTLTLPVSLPSDWTVVASATDAGGSSSGTVYASASMPLPNEPEALLDVVFHAPASGSSLADLVVEVGHPFPASCTVVYQPRGQAALHGQMNFSTGSIPFDYNATEHIGEIVADCGLFTMTRTVLTFAIPELYGEAPDADRDGIEDDVDDCDSTPQGEPVHPDGCSDAERDADGDGVSDAEDVCPGHDDSVDVDRDGIPDGCDGLIDSDGDGVSDAEDRCEGADDADDFDGDDIPDGCDGDIDGDGVANANDDCPETPAGTEVDANGCEVDPFAPEDSWLCQGPGIGPVHDLNEQYGYQNNPDDPFTCLTTVSLTGDEMVVWSNGIPNHDFISTRGCCADERDYDWTFPLNPVVDTDGNKEAVPERGAVAVAVNGVPIFGPEDGPGGDAVALDHLYYTENRQQIDLGICGGHSGGSTYHYHWDANCILWTPGPGEDMTDYHWTQLDAQTHSGIIGWSFDGFPIYGMYGWDEAGEVVQVTSSYQLKANGDDGYNGIDDWQYIEGMGDLDACNGRFGPTPEYPEGTYHYVSTPLSGSSNTHVDTQGSTVDMIGFPYFQLCYHGLATGTGKGGGGQGGPPQGQGDAPYGFMPQNIDWRPPTPAPLVAPTLAEALQGLLLLAVAWMAWTQRARLGQVQL